MKKNKRLKLGILSAAGVTAILALAVTVNILIGQLDIAWDMTSQKVYSISEQTRSILKGLEQDITIYILNSEENIPVDYRQILRQYEKGSNHIKLLYRDLTVYPGFASEYSGGTETKENSMLVVCGDRQVYLNSDDFQRTVMNPDYTYSTSYELEPLLTGAINSVNDGRTSIIYQTVGHSELSLTSASQTDGDVVLSSSVLSGLTRDNFRVEDLSLLNEDAVPEDADIVVIHAPVSDFSEADCDKLRAYLERGGNVYYIMDAALELDNLNALMREYGIEAAEGIVLEQDTSMIYGGGSESATPTYILPVVEDTEITHDLYSSHLPLIIPVAKGLTLHSDSKNTVTGLLTTSDYAYSKVNLYSQYLSREDEDIVGPFYLAALSEREEGGSLIVLASVNVLADNVDEVVSGNNSDFFLNGLNYMAGDTDKISIRGKEVSFDYNIYSSNEALWIGGMAILGIPLLILLTGIIVVVYRKKRSQGRRRSEENETGENGDGENPDAEDDNGDDGSREQTEDSEDSDNQEESADSENGENQKRLKDRGDDEDQERLQDSGDGENQEEMADSKDDESQE